MAWQARTEGKRPKGRPRRDTEDSDGMRNGVSVIAEVHDRWKAVCKLWRCTSRRGSAK